LLYNSLYLGGAIAIECELALQPDLPMLLSVLPAVFAAFEEAVHVAPFSVALKVPVAPEPNDDDDDADEPEQLPRLESVDEAPITVAVIGLPADDWAAQLVRPEQLTCKGGGGLPTAPPAHDLAIAFDGYVVPVRIKKIAANVIVIATVLIIPFIPLVLITDYKMSHL
jgi:hypothetical protein